MRDTDVIFADTKTPRIGGKKKLPNHNAKAVCFACRTLSDAVLTFHVEHLCTDVEIIWEIRGKTLE